MKKKTLFIDRDGTLIQEPADEQVDSIDKLEFLPGVFCALLRLQEAGYRFIMVTNQDALGQEQFPQADFDAVQELMMRIFNSQGIEFEAVLICPHLPEDRCYCRKPSVGLVMPYLVDQSIDLTRSYVIGDRSSDIELAQRLHIKGIQMGTAAAPNWNAIADEILKAPRRGQCYRKTRETNVVIKVNLDQRGAAVIKTGIGFFDHMLEQIANHAGMQLTINVKGDLSVDCHHTIEDTALALGQAIAQALGDKRGVERYAFEVPMDEAAARILLDLSGRAFCVFDGKFTGSLIGEFPTEMISHFYQSFASGLQATLHVNLTGDNDHHVCEAGFKALGRALGRAIRRSSSVVPSTKGVLC